MVDIRLPNITGASEKEQLQQLKSYIYQLSEQLQWAFDNINTAGGASNSSYVVNQPSRGASGGLSNKDAEVTFNALKSLIIKSADIVDAYYDEINKKLEGIYVAESDFGAYVEKTDLEIEATSTAITQNYDNLQVIISDNKNATNESLEAISENISNTRASVEETKSLLDEEIEKTNVAVERLDTKILDIKSYIKSGFLYKDKNGIPVYGVEIGQFSSVDGVEEEKGFVRITAKQMTFFDSNGNEVAYISDKKLYIGQAEITLSYKIGRLKDTVMGNGDVVTKVEGGDW